MTAATADLVIRGRIATLAGADGYGWVEALAVGGERVLAAGRPADVDPLIGPRTRRLILGADDVVLPGLTDGHLHLTDAALMARQLDLDGLDLAGALARVAAEHERRRAAGDRDGWLLGRGWSRDALGRWPHAVDLARVAPGRPVALWSHDLHSRWASREALGAAGVLAGGMADPPGGRVERGADGQPTGLLFEHAAGLVDRATPAATDEELAEAIGAYAARLAALGVVGCHDPGGLAPDPEARRGPALYGRLAGAGALPLRVHASVRPEQLAWAVTHRLRSGAPIVSAMADDPMVVRLAARARVGWLKVFADGALGSRTAALFAPFADEGSRGRLSITAGDLVALVRRAATAGIAPQVHAIGDRAVALALDVLAAVPAARGGPAWARVEHVQLARDRDAARFAGLRVAASVQPSHLLHDAPVARVAWPRRQARAYRWRSLAAGGAPLPFGTDAPVESPDPWPGIAVAVTRRVDGGTRPFPGAERLTLARALRGAILDPAIVTGGPAVEGRLVAGSRADLIVVPASALQEPVRSDGALATCRPRLTLLDGAEVWRAPDFDR